MYTESNKYILKDNFKLKSYQQNVSFFFYMTLHQNIHFPKYIAFNEKHTFHHVTVLMKMGTILWNKWLETDGLYSSENYDICYHTTTSYNDNGVVNRSLLSVIDGCLVQIKGSVAFFSKNWFTWQKASSNKQTLSTKVKYFSLAGKIYVHIQEELQSPAAVCTQYKITFPST